MLYYGKHLKHVCGRLTVQNCYSIKSRPQAKAAVAEFYLVGQKYENNNLTFAHVMYCSENSSLLIPQTPPSSPRTPVSMERMIKNDCWMKMAHFVGCKGDVLLCG